MQQRGNDSHAEQRLTHMPSIKLPPHKSIDFLWIFFPVSSISASLKITEYDAIWEDPAEKKRDFEC